MPLMPPKRSGLVRARFAGFHYTGEFRGTGTSYTPAAQDQWAIPFLVTTPERFNRIGIGLAAGGSAQGTVRLGIYTDWNQSGYPQSLLIEATSGGAMNLGTTAGFVDDTTHLDQYLFPGLCWLSVKVITAGTSQSYNTGSGAVPFGGPSFLNNSASTEASAIQLTGGWKLTSAGTGALGDPFPSGAAWFSSAVLVNLFKP